MIVASPEHAKTPGHILLNVGGSRLDHMTAVVVSASSTAASGVVAILRRAGLFAARRDGRSAHLVEDATSLKGRRSLRRFSAPRLIVISHDPIALIDELGAVGGDPIGAVKRAKDRIRLVFRIALQSDCPVLVVSHGLAIGRQADLAAVVRPFCGIDAPPNEVPPPANAPKPAGASRGIVGLRLAGDGSGADASRTIVIGGPPRSGSSMIAAMLHAAGLPLGEDLVSSTFESALQNMLFKTSSPRTWRRLLDGSWKAALADPRHFRLAWDGYDLPAIRELIADRRRDGPVWGFKRPGIGSFLRLGGLRMMDGPRLIMSVRDPVAIAARIGRAHDVETKVALRIARWFLLDTLETALRCRVPTLLISHEMAKDEMPALFDRLKDFCGLEAAAGRYDEIAAFVEQAGATYVKDFAAPFIGEVMDAVDHEIFGWVEAHQQGSVAVDILADDRRVASGLADTLTDAGLLCFAISLSPDEVTGSTRIRAVVSQSQAELRNSGLTLADLRRRAVGHQEPRHPQIGSVDGRL